MKSPLFVAAIVLQFTLAACGQDQAETPASATGADSTVQAIELTASPDDAAVFFITPADGETVSSPVRIEFGIRAMDVVKAGVDQPNADHHHLLINTDLPPAGLPIPADENHVHFGDGSTSTDLALPPG
jgi:hypothetical protein